MEMSLQLNCKTVFPYRGGVLKLNPLPRHSVTFATGYICSPCKAGWGVSFVRASADFSRRRQQKKVSVARSKGTAPKGFAPGNQNRSKKNARVKKGDSVTPVVTEVSGDDKKQTVDVDIEDDKEGEVEFPEEERLEVVDRDDEIVGDVGELALLDETVGELSLLDEAVGVVESNHGNISIIDEDVEIHELRKEEIPYNGSVGIVEDSEEGLVDSVEIDEDVKEPDANTDGEITDKTVEESSSTNDDRINEEDSVEIDEDVKEPDANTDGEITDKTVEESSSTDDDRINEEDSVEIDEDVKEPDANTDGEITDKTVEESSTTDDDRINEEDSVEIDEDVKEPDANTDGEITDKTVEESSTTDDDRINEEDSVEIDEDVKEPDANTDGEITDGTVEESSTTDDDRINEEASRLLKLELEANQRRQEIERLAEEKLSQGAKLFVYPPVVKPDQDIEVFFNKNLSALSEEPDVLIMGAFNDWKWKSFTVRLNKTNFKGDWWSCHLYVPREAYKIDFVFFNGQTVYDNNDQKDFCITVDGGMDALGFEEFLLEEKRKELEKLAREQAERERQAEEQRRIEAARAAKEEDRSRARVEVQRMREMLPQFLKNAVKSLDNVWYIEPREFKGNDLVRLYYNRSSGPLANANEIWIHGGHNSWKFGLSIVERLAKSVLKGGEWWYADVVVPDQALVLDWVFADGPPQKAGVYDNNRKQDFHAIVPMAIPDEQYWVEQEQLLFRKFQEERRLREEATRAKAEKIAQMKAETKERTLKRFLLSQKHIVYTDPLDVQAGSTVTICYNPSNTNLNGKPEVWLRCSFNRWSHRNGPLPPQRMLPAEKCTHVKASVKVPLDAYMMDFVFSECENGGVFDNKFGMDYHIPVFGGIVKEPPLHIIHIAVEMAPIAKVGGLGDVVTSLSRAVQDLNHNVDIILPKYDVLNLSNVKDFKYHKSYSWGGTEIKVWHGKVEGLSVYFLEPQNGFFQVGCVYGRGNDGERFGFFCHAALEFLLQNGFHPDIIHCHDWSSAPVAWLFKDNYTHYGLSKARVVFTIHNLEFGAHFIGKAMQYTDKATTVSPTYSREIAGNPVIAPHLHKFHGIINGIDPDIWDPYNDNFIPVPYTSENVVEGKRAAKEALQQRLGIKKADLPLVGIITRLTHQKGIHLIKHAMWRTLERGGQVVLLGSAPDPRIQNDFVNLANELHSAYHDRARLCLAYDEPLSHLIYAGADFILVPSIFEPCGLTQLTAMRYGSIPVVRKTGGLYDTVFDIDHDKDRAQAQGLETNGFSFDGADTGGVDYALNRAISAWYEGRDWFNTLCKRVMEQDWSWNRPALDYLELYHSARKAE